MAGAVINSTQGRGGRRRRRFTPMAEINVTPFVDVMLVLLIIFMVSAPLLTAGVPIDLPQTSAKPLTGDTEPITITVNREGKVYLQETEIPVGDLVPKLTAIANNRQGYDERIYVRGDKGSAYGDVMKVMGALNAAGFRRIGLVTDADTGS
jgi:biopolymer transport protein TolR